jgi:hypothetical protein
MNHEYHKKVLMLRLQGGLCNRVHALISGILWAEDLGRRLALYWPIADNMPYPLEEFLDINSIPGLCCVHHGCLSNSHVIQNPVVMEAVLQIFGNSEEIRIESYSAFHPDLRKKRGIDIMNNIKWFPVPKMSIHHIIDFDPFTQGQ